VNGPTFKRPNMGYPVIRSQSVKKPKRGTFGKRLWKGLECNTGIRDRGLRQHLQGRYEVKDLGGGLPRYLKKPDLKKVQ
jgi:hypothetical protein